MEEAVEVERMEVGLRRKDWFCRSQWVVGVNQIDTTTRLR